MSWASRHNLLARAVNRNLGGVSVIWGAVSGEGILESNTEMVVGDQVLSVEHVVHNLPAEQFGGIEYGDGLLVNGQLYKARQEPMLVGDGSFCFVLLEKVEEDPMSLMPYSRKLEGYS